MIAARAVTVALAVSLATGCTTMERYLLDRPPGHQGHYGFVDKWNDATVQDKVFTVMSVVALGWVAYEAYGMFTTSIGGGGGGEPAGPECDPITRVDYWGQRC